jgi:hypothetical protein
VTKTLSKPLAITREQTIVVVPAPIAAVGPQSLFQRAWPPAMLTMVVILTVAWAALLGYGFICLAGLAF